LVQEVGCARKGRLSNARQWIRTAVVIAGSAVALVLAWAFLSPKLYSWMEARAGQGAAERDWRHERAVVFVFSPNGITYRRGRYFFQPNYDSRTGLKVTYRSPRRSDEFFKAYNQRVQELITAHGLPPWSVKEYLLPEDELIALLETRTMDQVSEFPQTLGPGLVLRKGGTFSRWDYTSSVPEDAVQVEARHGGSIGISDSWLPLYVCRLGKDSKIVVIRGNQNWLGVFHEDGRHFISVFTAPNSSAAPDSSAVHTTCAIEDTGTRGVP